MVETVLNSWWQSKLLRRLDSICGIGAAVILGRTAYEEGVIWIGWALLVSIVVLLTVTNWPDGALLVLVGMSAMPRYYVEVFGWKARPEHFAALIVCAAVVTWLLSGQRKVRLEKLDYWVLGYVVINFVSSAFGSPEPASTLRWAFQNSLAIAPYFVMRVAVQNLSTLQRAFRILLGVGIAESLYGIFCYGSFSVLGTSFGMELNQYADISAPFGSQYEANLFGAYTACCAVMLLALYLAGGKHRLGALIGFLVTSVATFVSFSRGALLAFVVIAIWVFWKARPAAVANKRPKRSNKVVLAAVGLAVLLIIGGSPIGDILQQRFSELYLQGLADDTAITRYVLIVEALQEIPSHPLLGTGTASLQLSFDFGQYIPGWAGNPTWVGNIVVRCLHDTGIIGFTALLGFFISLWLKVRRGLRGQSTYIPMLFALWSGVLLYGITFQSNDGTILAFSWVHFGLMASAAILLDPSVRAQHPIEGASF